MEEQRVLEGAEAEAAELSEQQTIPQQSGSQRITFVIDITALDDLMGDLIPTPSMRAMYNDHVQDVLGAAKALEILARPTHPHKMWSEGYRAAEQLSVLARRIADNQYRLAATIAREKELAHSSNSE